MCSVPVPQLAKPCFTPAGTIISWPGLSVACVSLHPDVGLALEHVQHLFDRVQMGRRAVARLAPLLEQAELRPAVRGRNAHARQHALAPFLARRLR